jgi:hypothetical protein
MSARLVGLAELGCQTGGGVRVGVPFKEDPQWENRTDGRRDSRTLQGALHRCASKAWRGSDDTGVGVDVMATRSRVPGTSGCAASTGASHTDEDTHPDVPDTGAQLTGVGA